MLLRSVRIWQCGIHGTGVKNAVTAVCITAQPLLENIDIEKYLDDIELVVVGGESDRNARPLNYDWVLNIREQCVRQNTDFEFRQCGTYFIKDSKRYTLQTKDLCRQAKLADIDFKRTVS